MKKRRNKKRIIIAACIPCGYRHCGSLGIRQTKAGKSRYRGGTEEAYNRKAVIDAQESRAAGL